MEYKLSDQAKKLIEGGEKYYSPTLNNILGLSSVDTRKQGLSEERVRAILPVVRDYVGYWREYPDKFIDFLCGPNSKFKLFFYQRIFLRAVIRHKYAYATFPRAYSKSFLSVLTLIVRCILYPGAKLFVCSGGKEQAASIAKEKVEELCDLIPALKREIDWRPGKTLMGKDYVKVEFKNGSRLDVVAARNSARGGRRHGGLLEEVILIDGTALNEVIIPLMNVSRRTATGEVDPDETLNKSQIYVTTAGWKGTFPYDKLIQLLIWQIVKPGQSIVLGGTWRVPVLMKLLDRNFVKDLKADGTFNEASFAREYESVWSGTVEDAFFNAEVFDKHRVLNQPEYEYSGRSAKDAYYVISVDVGRKGCASVACVFKVTPQPQGNALKTLVNIYTYDEEHFEDQAINLKKLYHKYNARSIVIDGNGLGIGLVDYMVKNQIDPITNETWFNFGVENDDEGFYKKYKTEDTIQDAMYIIKANAPINTEAHANAQSQLSSGKVKFLLDERTAKAKLLNTKLGQNMTPEERAEYLKPFTLTSILKEEMMNLREEHDGVNIILKPANRSIKKDKFSAFEYGLYYIKQQEDSKKKKRKFNVKDMLFMN
ncbi:MAG: hypothetical protein MSA56_06675 [Clostridium sp.]|nr:hypothetical protein [Clostridium sp.]